MLSELTASAKRLALVGMAKNTGKTVALSSLLRELEGQGISVGVTSVGRDGEEHDVIDSRIEKPRLHLPAGSLVATTDALLRASGVPHEPVQDTGVRTPLGRVLIARVHGAGAVEVAGPSVAADVRAVSDAMLAHGAERVLIDGAVDRRAASSPQVADGLVLATGAVLHRDIAEVVLQTKDAVDLARLPGVEDSFGDAAPRLRALASANAAEPARGGPVSLLVEENLAARALPPRFILTSDAEQVAQVLDENERARWLITAGALPDRFLRSLLHPLLHRRRELAVVVADPTKVFLWKRGPEWYRRQGVHLYALDSAELVAVTVNPVAPQSHRFDSAELQTLLSEMIPDVPMFDVLHPDYADARFV